MGDEVSPKEAEGADLPKCSSRLVITSIREDLAITSSKSSLNLRGNLTLKPASALLTQPPLILSKSSPAQLQQPSDPHRRTAPPEWGYIMHQDLSQDA